MMGGEEAVVGTLVGMMMGGKAVVGTLVGVGGEAVGTSVGASGEAVGAFSFVVLGGEVSVGRGLKIGCANVSFQRARARASKAQRLIIVSAR